MPHTPTSLALAVSTVLVLLVTGGAARADEPERIAHGGAALVECPVLTPPPTQEELDRYLCGDPRLGPADLPRSGVVGELLRGYDRLGERSPAEFVRLHRQTVTDPATGEERETWRYPDHHGFVFVYGQVQSEPETVYPGLVLDRFGSPRGAFLALAGTPYAQRSLPPDSLNTWPEGPEHNYYCYLVLEAFTVEAGPAAAAFEQPGGGEQLQLRPEYVSEAAGQDGISVESMVEWGYMEERPAEDCAVDRRYGLAA